MGEAKFQHRLKLTLLSGPKSRCSNIIELLEIRVSKIIEPDSIGQLASALLMINESAVSIQQNRLIVLINSKTNVSGVMFSSWNEVGFFICYFVFTITASFNGCSTLVNELKRPTIARDTP